MRFEKNTCQTCISEQLPESMPPCAGCDCNGSHYRPTKWFVEIERLQEELAAARAKAAALDHAYTIHVSKKYTNPIEELDRVLSVIEEATKQP